MNMQLRMRFGIAGLKQVQHEKIGSAPLETIATLGRGQERRKVVHLAQRHALHAEDVVGGGQVEEDVGNHDQDQHSAELCAAQFAARRSHVVSEKQLYGICSRVEPHLGGPV